MIKVIKIICASICVISGIILAVFLLPFTGLKAMSVLTGSMTPAIPQDSLVIIQRTRPSQLRSGDVITYINPRNTSQTITHRIVEVKSDKGLSAFITKGDANQVADQEILGGNVVGKVVWHYPKIGGLLNHSKGWPVIVLFVFIPAAFIIYDEIRLLKRTLKKSSSPPAEPPQDQNNKPGTPRTRSPHSRPKPNIDGLVKRVGLTVFLILFVGGVTRAALFSQASLIGNTISIINNGNGGNSGLCPQPNHNGSISDTGPGSTNSITFNDNCNITEHSTTNIGVINNNQQQSASGNGDQSGEANNSNQTNTSINIGH